MIKNNPFPKIYTELKCLWKKMKEIEQSPPGSGIQSIQEGDNISIDNTDPQNPIVSAIGEEQQFVQITEGANTGWGLKYRADNPNYYGNIGNNAVDLSYSDTNSTTVGATGNYSTVSGGYFNTASGTHSTVSGGPFNTANSLGEWVGGLYGTIPTGQSATKWSATDRLFNIGNGNNATSRRDAFTILKNGLATLPSVTNTLIDAEPTGKAVITREWVEDAINDLVIPEQVNLTAGTNINITGTYPNLTINSTASGGGGDTNIIESISRNGTPITPDGSKNVDIPIFSTSGAGLVPARVGSEATKYLREDGTWVTPTNTSSIWDLDASLNLSLKDFSGLNNTGTSSILIGSGAGNNNTAWGTVGIGYETVQDVDFNYNIGIGTYAGKSINSGDNTAIGTSAGESYQGENGHAVLIGSNAGKEAKQYTGGLIAIGRNAAENFGGTSNADQDAVIIGHSAGQNGKNLWRGVFIGLESGQEYGGDTAMSGVMNTAVGGLTLNTGEGMNNTAIGYSAFRSGSGNHNVAIGSYWVSSAGGTPLGAGRDMVGDNNTIVGGWNGVSLQGNNNIQIGFEQAHSTKGNFNTIIGGGRDLFNDTGNYRVSIGSHFSTAVRLQTNDVAIGRNTPIFVRDNKLGVGLNTSNGTPVVPREKLDIGDNGTMIGEGVKYVEGSNNVLVKSDTLTADRVQQLQDEDGTIALVETSGKRVILPIELSNGVTLPEMTGSVQEPFAPIDLFDVCPSVDLNYIDWEITWKVRGTMFKATALGDYNLQLTWSSEDCFQITGETMSTVEHTFGDAGSETKLILYY